MEGNVTASGEISVEKGKNLMPFLQNVAPYISTEEAIGWLDSVSLAYNSTCGTDGLAFDADVHLNKVNLGSVEMIGDVSSDTAYLSISPYQSTAIATPMGSDAFEYTEAMHTLQEIADVIPNAKAMKK